MTNTYKTKIEVNRSYIKKKVNGVWEDNKDRPCLIIFNRWSKFKVELYNVKQLIQDLQDEYSMIVLRDIEG